ncbi:hypothetical protein AB205_0151500 [Aquarana catesbeiana]|uniref:Uncharacterized protein n=1 Tax=Aquarana catesbeiana TaxID=8400 RepID=A0A2G9SDM3_AQUCT|nr:hypothetical protein AB205_0151500 [Aquarana catesbeiana]
MREEKDCITCKKKNSKTKDLGVDMARNGRNRVLFFETSRDNVCPLLLSLEFNNEKTLFLNALQNLHHFIKDYQKTLNVMSKREKCYIIIIKIILLQESISLVTYDII